MKKALADLRIVTIGGGSGGFAVNSGLKLYPVHPTAICTVFDSGGSTGVLKDEFGALPQGDIRRCLLALTHDDQHLLRELFNHRFPDSNGTSSISKHSLGNLILLGAEQIWGPIEGTKVVGKLLNVHGTVLPVSIDPAQLCAELNDGTPVQGESKIDTRSLDDDRTIIKVWLEPNAVICREAYEAILAADLLVVGPGDLDTSLIPNFLVDGVAEAIERSHARLVYVGNLMTKWQETRGFTPEKFLKVLCSYGIGRKRFDAAFFNNSPVPQAVALRYEKNEKARPVVFDDGAAIALSAYADKVIAGDFLNKRGIYENLIRHDSATLAKAIIDFAMEG